MFDMTFIKSVGGLRALITDPAVVLVELLLIGLSVNWIAGVLQGTRGTRPLRGVLTVLVVAALVINVLAERFGWERLSLLYQYFLFGLAFIALVAFQPELRRAVIRAGDVRSSPRNAPIESRRRPGAVGRATCRATVTAAWWPSSAWWI